MEIIYPHDIFLRIQVKTQFGLKVYSISSDDLRDALALIEDVKEDCFNTHNIENGE